MTIIIGAIAGLILFEATPLSDDEPGDDQNIQQFVAEGLLSFSPKIFFFVLLPPIIFNSGYMLQREVFFRHIVPISLFACVGTAISTFVVAVILQVLKQFGLFGDFEPRFTELLVFGSLISATDPVSTLTVFQKKQVDPQLFYLVFGESVLNDAIGLVLFKSTSKLVGNEDNVEKIFVVILDFFLDFTVGFVGSMVMGLLAGLCSAFFLKTIDFRNTPLIELSLFFLIMYLPFFFAELLGLSGIVTILFTGISARRYATHNLSESTEEGVDQLFRLIAHLAETSIFLELGLCVVSIGEKYLFQWAFAGYAIIACLIGRALNIYPLRSLYNVFLLRREAESHLKECFRPDMYDDELTDDTSYTEQKGRGNNNNGIGIDVLSMDSRLTMTPVARKDLKIRNNTAHMLWFSGLRGAVAYACAKTFPNEFGNRPAFVFTTMAIVMFTVFVFGCTTELALHIFNIEVMVDEDKYIEENDTLDKMDYINNFEKKYIHPRVVRDWATPGDSIELQNVSVVGDGMNDDKCDDSTILGGMSTRGGNSAFQSMDRPYDLESRKSRKRSTTLYDYGLTISPRLSLDTNSEFQYR